MVLDLVNTACIRLLVALSTVSLDLGTHRHTKGPPKIYGKPGPGFQTGGLGLFLSGEKGGHTLFLTTKKGGPGIFFTEKKWGPLLFFPSEKGGQQVFFTTLIWGANTFLRTIFWGALTFFGRKGTGLYFFSPISDFPISFPRKLRH